ncbi:hypothetical protein OE749_02440 [Aestuariibacter sp. AA17]|uniref:Lipoprotein n=1 Tax=Fluctibacter corallii TaxID=2984329 RepID=A0ABT3A4H1_9ALTE|nr:hypothetical protein [Aestuariibacter sp. AA17]MCV2883556.1 hypothetical protein [Aestuariibacter sp. AA17]
MQGNIQRVALFILSFSLLTACDTQPVKTESMLYRERADNEANTMLSSAESLIKQVDKTQLIQHVYELQKINSMLKDVAEVYRNKSILDWKGQRYLALQGQLNSYHRPLSLAAIPLLQQLHNETKLLREQVEQAKTRPQSASSRSPDDMVNYLSKHYNQRISACCLMSLSDIEQLLPTNETYIPLKRLILNINLSLTRMIKEEGYGDTLLREINQLDSQLR